MREATELNEEMLEEAEHLAFLEPEDDGKEVSNITTPLVPLGPLNTTPTPIFVSGTFLQVTNLLNIMDSESAKTDTTGPGLDMRKTLASVIITEKATTDPCVVMNALIRCLQMPEVGMP